MRSHEVRALGELSGDAIGGVAARIEEAHQGIAGRVFGVLGVSAEPVKAIHDGVAHGVYVAVRTALGATAKAAANTISVTRPPEAPQLERAPAGRIALGALNGAFGDLLEQRDSALAVRMTIKRGGEDVVLTREGLRASFPDATGRVVVFLHGLCETEEAWLLGARRTVPYGARLRVEAGYTPVYIRYNSGRHISDNGLELARLLDELDRCWPEDVHEVALIGHSMGALVARSACHQAAGQSWVSKVRHIFMLGAPHHGAPLEKFVNAAGARLALLPETRALATALNLRSAGVKDLGHGYLLEQDWFGHDRDAFPRNAGSEIPFLPTANHYFVSASIARDRDGPAGRVIGDLLVMPSSAWAHRGRGQRLQFPVDNYRHIGGINHFGLLNHPAIYDQIRTWLAGRRELPAAPPALAAGPIEPDSTSVGSATDTETSG